VAFLQPAIRLFADAALDQGFLNEVMRRIERRRSGSASLRTRKQRVFVKVLNGLLVHLHRGAKARVQIAVEEKLIGSDAANVRLTETGQLAARFEIFLGRKTLGQALHGAIDIGVGRLRRARHVRFAADNPLINETIHDFRVAFRFALHEQLIAREQADVTEKDDVIFNPRDDTVDHFLGASERKEKEARDQRARNSRRSGCHAHQKLDPKLKNTCKAGRRVDWNPSEPV
jgi:hypothetical protein